MDQPIINQPTQPNINPPPSSITPALKKNFPLILVVFLVLLAIGAGIVIGKYFYGQKGTPQETEVIPTTTQPLITPTLAPDSTVDWKTYKDESLGFSISYPASLFAINKTTELQNYLKETDEKCKKTGGCGGGPRASWVIDFISESDRQKNDTENPPFNNRSYQFSLSIYEGITINTLLGVGLPEFIIGNKVGVRDIKKGNQLYGGVPVALYGVDNEGKTYLFTFTNRTDTPEDLRYMESILSTFKFLDQNVNTPITIQVRSPYEIGTIYNFTINYKEKPGDKVVPFKYDGEKENYYSGVDIIRDSIKLQIRFPFEGVSQTYNKPLNPYIIPKVNFTDGPVYRIKPDEEDKFIYVSNYEEGPSGCTQHIPIPAACSLNNLFTKIGGLDITCLNANSSSVAECDQIVGSLVITRSIL